MADSDNLRNAKVVKNDEYYTKASDIENELRHYKEHFRGKTILCNCDDPTWSEFWRYFHLNFAFLGLKKLISTHYDSDKPTYKMVYEGGNDADYEVGEKTKFMQNGDFESKECLDLLDECDIVATNPPFSLARRYLRTLMEHNKKFVIVGDLNWITYKEVFPLITENRIWLGNNHIKEFRQPDGTFKQFGNKLWFTNLDIPKRHEKLILWEHYSPDKYPKFDNFDAISVNKVNEIPCDYDGLMGVPVSYLDRWNPDQFEVVGADFQLAQPEMLPDGKKGTGRFYLCEDDGRKRLYSRIVIRKKSA